MKEFLYCCILGILIVIMYLLLNINSNIENKIQELDSKILKKEPNNIIIPAKKNKNEIKIQPKELVIDINKIIKIESSGNPKALNKRSGARGLCQIMRLTWFECCSRLNYDWSFDEAYDPVKNVIIGEYYINKRIPQMLKYYNIPDNIDNRLISYNWGIGNLDKARRSYGKINLPKETQNYIKKYKGM